MASVRPARFCDVWRLAPNLRKADAEECLAGTGNGPLKALLNSYLGSTQVFVAEDDEGPFCMFGSGPTGIHSVGFVWMLGTPGLQKNRIQFARESRMWVDRLHDGFPVLWNFTDARNEVHHRWLRWCGFTFIKKHEQFGVERRPFYEFVRIKHV
ncbi:MAG: hypothetical protein ACK4FJ_18590 [Ferrovibrio sp.]|uniref:hypothetical protein n=1 Tax=Ferrovibrio sp. TaxID=1917215 RepID=UPI003919B898